MAVARSDAHTVGHYLLGQSIGKGEHSQVRLGVHVPTDTEVAVKEYIKKGEAQALSKRVRRSVTALRKCSTCDAETGGIRALSNLLRPLEAFETDSAFYIVTELADGGNLEEAMHNLPSDLLTEESLKPVFKRMVHAVQRIHRAGYYNGRIRLKSFLIDAEFNIKFKDVHRCRQLKEHHRAGAEGSLQHEEFIDSIAKATDVWTLGALLLRLLSGHRPTTQQTGIRGQHSGGVSDFPHSLALGSLVKFFLENSSQTPVKRKTRENNQQQEDKKEKKLQEGEVQQQLIHNELDAQQKEAKEKEEYQELNHLQEEEEKEEEKEKKEELVNEKDSQEKQKKQVGETENPETPQNEQESDKEQIDQDTESKGIVETASEPVYNTFLSEDAINLLYKLLDRDPATRIKLADILKHKWLHDSDEIVLDPKTRTFQTVKQEMELTLSHEIVRQVAMMTGHSTSEVMESVTSNRLNRVCAFYWLLENRLACGRGYPDSSSAPPATPVPSIATRDKDEEEDDFEEEDYKDEYDANVEQTEEQKETRLFKDEMCVPKHYRDCLRLLRQRREKIFLDEHEHLQKSESLLQHLTEDEKENALVATKRAETNTGAQSKMSRTRITPSIKYQYQNGCSLCKVCGEVRSKPLMRLSAQIPASAGHEFCEKSRQLPLRTRAQRIFTAKQHLPLPAEPSQLPRPNTAAATVTWADQSIQYEQTNRLSASPRYASPIYTLIPAWNNAPPAFLRLASPIRRAPAILPVYRDMIDIHLLGARVGVVQHNSKSISELKVSPRHSQMQTDWKRQIHRSVSAVRPDTNQSMTEHQLSNLLTSQSRLTMAEEYNQFIQELATRYEKHPADIPETDQANAQSRTLAEKRRERLLLVQQKEMAKRGRTKITPFVLVDDKPTVCFKWDNQPMKLCI